MITDLSIGTILGVILMALFIGFIAYLIYKGIIEIWKEA